jgi:hypothetical protein
VLTYAKDHRLEGHFHLGGGFKAAGLDGIVEEKALVVEGRHGLAVGPAMDEVSPIVVVGFAAVIRGIVANVAGRTVRTE